ncbi:MAG TPA: PUA domain-containing protein [Nitrosopumilaceae archaeon]|nr:PUA domain-containing protein [Nitrosopumilaceae archaeon]
MKSNLLSKSTTVETLATISSQWNIDLPKVKTLTNHEIDDDASLITGDGFSAIKLGETYIPFLSETGLLERFPKIVVDMGAVKFVCNGATVMRPGVKNYSEFEKDQIVCVVEESRNKFLAIGRSLVSSKDMATMTKGEVVKNLHYVSDRFWEAAKEIKR